MVLTTTPYMEGKQITTYLGIVFGEVIIGIDAIKDLSASFHNLFGGRSSTYENELANARERALAEMEVNAKKLGANAIVGVDIDYETVGAMLMVSVSGTAVYTE